MKLISRAMDTYQSSHTNTASASSSSSTVNAREPQLSPSPYSDSKDVVRESAEPPPYTRYADDDSRQHQQQSQPRFQPQPETARQLQPQAQLPQAQAAQRAYQNAQYQNTAPIEPQTPVYRHELDQVQSYGSGYRYGRGADSRGYVGRGGANMLMGSGISNRQYQSRANIQAEYDYDYDDMDYGRGRRGRRGRGRRGGGGPLHLLFKAARNL